MLTGIWTLTLFSIINGASLLVAYIANNSFPQPLKGEEEKKLLQEMQSGDSQARDSLIEHNLRLVAHLIKRFENSGVSNDDLISIGTIGLIKAIDSFDPNKKVRLATYAARCIENEVLMYLRSIKKTKADVSLYDPIGVDKEGNEINLLSILGTEYDTVAEELERKQENQQLYQYLNILEPRERTIITLRYGLGKQNALTQREIAVRLNISRSYVSRIEKKALIRLNTAFQQDDA